MIACADGGLSRLVDRDPRSQYKTELRGAEQIAKLAYREFTVYNAEASADVATYRIEEDMRAAAAGGNVWSAFSSPINYGLVVRHQIKSDEDQIEVRLPVHFQGVRGLVDDVKSAQR